MRSILFAKDNVMAKIKLYNNNSGSYGSNEIWYAHVFSLYHRNDDAQT